MTSLNSNENSVFTAEQLDFINSLITSQLESSLENHSKSLTETLNKSLNGLSAKLSKQIEKISTSASSNAENLEESTGTPTSASERLTLKQLQAEIAQLREENIKSKLKAESAIKKAQLAPYAEKTLDSEAFYILFNSLYGDKLKVEEGTGQVYLEDESGDISSIEDVVNKFFQTKGQILLKPEIETTTQTFDSSVSKVNEETFITEQEQLAHFMKAFEEASNFIG